MSREFQDYYENLYDGEEFEIPNNILHLGCCDCGGIHMIDFRIERGKLFASVQKDKIATRKMRATGTCNLQDRYGHEDYIMIKLRDHNGKLIKRKSRTLEPVDWEDSE